VGGHGGSLGIVSGACVEMWEGGEGAGGRPEGEERG